MFFNYVKDLIDRGNELNTMLSPRTNKTDLDRLHNGFPQTYKSLNVGVGFGQGNWAKIPWIAFMGNGQKVTEGIYPVLLYYRENNILILAYGISANKKSSLHWDTTEITSSGTIGKYFKDNKIKAFPAYNKSYIFKIYDADKVDKSIEGDIDIIISYYKRYLMKAKTAVTASASSSAPVLTSASLPSVTPSKSTMIPAVVSAIKSSGLIYKKQFISRFVISLMTKPFVILSGLSGSGKTQLAIAFTKAISADFQKQVRIVPVGADWTNREPLLGYPNGLKEGSYVQPDSNVLQLILDAAEDPTHPYFLILDEMNLSYVERYFADFLSALESKEAIPLWKKSGSEDDEVPEAISLPKNLFIIGTINVDETTYMFSPKVLDRANVLEFKIDYDDMMGYLDSAPDVDLDKIEGSISDYAELFVECAQEKVASGFAASEDTLLSFFKELKVVNAEFGYRSAAEIGRFVALATDLGGMKEEDAIDAAIVQKMLPKLHGSQKKLTPFLKALWKLCDTSVELKHDSVVSVSTIYKLSADKLIRMFKSAYENGFTSFAEA